MGLSFANPMLLGLLPLAVIWLIWRRSSIIAGINLAALTHISGVPSVRWPKWVQEYGRFGCIILCIVALAGPRTPDERTRLTTQSITLMIVLDTSGSMEEETFTWDAANPPITRREAAKQAFRLFISGGPGPNGYQLPGRSTEQGTDAIGLITFSTYPQTVCPPTLNHSVLIELLDRIPRASPLDTASNIGDSLAEAIIRLDNSRSQRHVIILLSDGEHNYDLADPARAPLKPREAARLAAAKGIVIYAIDTGGEPPAGDTGEQRRAGREVNEQLAELTGGRAFVANDGTQLREVCQQIDQLERQPLISPVYRRYHDYTPWLITLTLLGLAILFTLEHTIHRPLF